MAIGQLQVRGYLSPYHVLYASHAYGATWICSSLIADANPSSPVKQWADQEGWRLESSLKWILKWILVSPPSQAQLTNQLTSPYPKMPLFCPLPTSPSSCGDCLWPAVTLLNSPSLPADLAFLNQHASLHWPPWLTSHPKHALQLIRSTCRPVPA